MTDWRRPGEGEGDVELAAPLELDGAVAETPTLGAMTGEEAAAAEDAAADQAADEVVRTRTRRAPNTLMLMGGAIIVLAIAQVVFSWLLFHATSQLRDQSAAANGLQRCLIQAQLNANASTDTSGTAYKAAVQGCLKK